MITRNFLAAIALLAPASLALAADPAAATISEATPELTYTAGPFLVRNASAGAIVTSEQCANPALPCDEFELTVDLSPAYLDAHPEDIVLMQWRWPNPFEDYDFRVFDENGDEVTSAGSASDPENAQIGAKNGKYTIRGVPFTVFGGSFTATLKLASPVEAPVPPLPAGLAPEYATGAPPQGVGDGEGEPSIGYNPKTHHVMFYGAHAQTLRGTMPEELAEPMPESCDLGWEDVSSIYTGTVSSVIGADPILFTDQATGRTFVSNLQIPIPAPPSAIGLNSQFEYTDDDGATWIPGQIGPPEGGYDHETVGSGPYPAALSFLANPINGGSAVYYCSQAGFTAFCSRSDDGGLTFPNGFPIYNAETDGFGGIHGHVKVAPDGSVYVPVKACGDTQCVTESDNGGITWEVRHVPDTSPGPSDPSVGIATDGTVYFCYVNGDGHPHVTISRDKGLTWVDDYDIGASQHIVNTVFPEAVSGDPDRTSCAFVGTNRGGNWQALDFPGIWYGYIATTYDAGKSWHTVNVTPDDPIQRESGVWLGGGSHDQRNLLDFNEITMDERGRALFGFADGCIGDCATGVAPNTFTSKAGVTRQIGGKPLFAQFDPPAEPTSPGAACLAGKRDPAAAHLIWRLPRSGGAQIASYKIYRGMQKGDETLLTQTADAKARFDDFTADPAVATYTYKITALNAAGEGLFSNIVELPVIPIEEVPHESSCALPGITLFQDGAGDNDGGVPGQDLGFASMAEPKDMPGKLVLTMKVDDLSTPPPSTRWVTYYDAIDGSAVRYVAMVTTNGTPSFEYGTYGRDPSDTVGLYTPDGTPDAESTYGADGTIAIVLDKVALGLKDGDVLKNMSTSVRSSSAANGAGLTVDSSDGVAQYTLVGTDVCNAAIVPTPTPTPTPVARETQRFGGALGLWVLLPLFGAAMRRRRLRD
jgi:hypothetical protein